MKRVLVTGGSGFLGSHIADALSDQGYLVTILDSKESPYLRKDQSIVIGSILDIALIEKVISTGFDAVYHLAALADLNEAKTKPRETVEVNILGTITILEACVRYNVKRLIFGSSVYVYSNHGGFYRCSKQACENYIEEFSKLYNVNFTILRFGSLYGTRSNETNGVYRLLSQAMNGNRVIYNGQEDDKREYIHVQDAAKLSAQALEERYSNKHLTLTGNDRLTIAELFKMFSEILNKPVEVVYKTSEAPNNGHYSITPYAFTPKVGLKVTSPEYVDMGQGLIQVMEVIHNKTNLPR